MIKATVRCPDGHHYPCQFIDWTNDYGNLLPMAFIRFTGNHPEDSNKVMVVNMISINFGGQNEKETMYPLSTNSG